MTHLLWEARLECSPVHDVPGVPGVERKENRPADKERRETFTAFSG